MKKIYRSYSLLFAAGLFLLLFAASCKKEHSQPASKTGGNPLGTIGLYESGAGTAKRVLIPVTKMGTVDISYLCTFDTGSAGLVIDAHGILPASMVTLNGIQVPGDSVIVNGITVTSQQLSTSYGDADNGVTAFGNLCYGPITFGDQNGNMKTNRIAFLLVYRAAYFSGGLVPQHSFDVFGVAPGTNDNFGGIASPLSYLKVNNNLTSGFRLHKFKNSAFTGNPTYVPGLVSIGLTQDDLSASGFTLLSYPLGGSSPWFYGNITFGASSIPSATIQFDTGAPVSLLEDYLNGSGGTLPGGVVVKVTTVEGFNYQYTTGNVDNVTVITSPAATQNVVSSFGIDFFVNNEYLVDYTNHKIGLKAN